MSLKKLFSFCSNNLYAVLLCLVGFVLYSSAITYRYLHFSYYDWDQALIGQSLWDLLHGKLYSTLYGFNIFGDHSTFINLLALPLFAVFTHPLTISYVEIFLFSVSALFFYFMILEDLDKDSALLMTFAYLFFAPNLFSMCNDFNTEATAPLFILLMVYFFRKKQIRNFYFSFLLLFLFKESMPLIIGMVGLWGIFAKDRNRILWGVIPIVLSVIYLFIMVKWAIPYFRGMSQYALLVRYPYLGNNMQEIIAHLLSFKMLRFLFLFPPNTHYLLALFCVFILPALFSPSVLLLISPIILYHLLSIHSPEKTIHYYYGALITPIIFLASVQTLKKFNFLRPYHFYICCVFVLCVCIQIFTCRSSIAFKLGLGSHEDVHREWQLVKMIPPDAGTVASFKYLPALSLRENLFSFQKVYDSVYQDPGLYKRNDFYTGKTFSLPDNVSYALINFNDGYIERYVKENTFSNRIDDFLKSGAWGSMDVEDSIVLFKKGTKDKYPLFDFIDKSVIPEHPVNLTIGKKINLYGYNLIKQPDRIHIIFYWKLLQLEERDVNLFIDLIGQNDKIIKRLRRPICYRIWPTRVWQKDQLIEEHQYVSLPPEVQGQIKSLMVGFYDFQTGKVLKTDSKDPLGRIDLKIAN